MIQHKRPPETRQMHKALSASGLVEQMLAIVERNGGGAPISATEPLCWVAVTQAGSMVTYEVIMHYTRHEGGSSFGEEAIFTASTDLPFGPAGSPPLTAELLNEVRRIARESRPSR